MFPSVLALAGSNESIVTNSRQVRLATGLFPVVSLLNHSCSPNTSVSFTSTVATIRAAQRIAKGQEILHCYGEPGLLSTALPCLTAHVRRIRGQESVGTGLVPVLILSLFWKRECILKKVKKGLLAVIKRPVKGSEPCPAYPEN